MSLWFGLCRDIPLMKESVACVGRDSENTLKIVTQCPAQIRTVGNYALNDSEI